MNKQLKNNDYTLDNVLLSAIATAHRNSFDVNFSLGTNYNKNDIRRFLTVEDRKILSTHIGRANNYRMIKATSYRHICCLAGQTFLDEFIQSSERFEYELDKDFIDAEFITENNMDLLS